jgi:DNA-binding transcriptional MerR regulator
VTAEPAEDRVHLSIGEVLANLRGEFPDVTISKIRFLESQGLIDPERTPSGYRKFYTDDLDRLRWILYQQREHFLPLRVIKERLDRFGPSGAPGVDSANGDTPTTSTPPPAPRPIIRHRDRPRHTSGDMPTLPLEDFDDDEQTPPEEQLGELEPAAAGSESDGDRDGAGDSSGSPVITERTRSELLRSAGISDAQLDELESYALITPFIGASDQPLYDEDALMVARLAAGFHARGIEARHLKMYQHFADRESTLFAQVLLQYVRQRNPAARARLQQELEELAKLGRRLRTAMLRSALRQSLTE